MQQITHILTIAHRRLTLAAMAASVVLSATAASADVRRIPISTDQLSGLLSSCLRQGGEDPGTSSGPVMCCATNEEGTKWCVTCFSGTEQDPNDCSVTTKVRASVRLRQTTSPTAGRVATAPKSTPRAPLFSNLTIVAPNN